MPSSSHAVAACAQKCLHMLGLPQRKAAFAGGDDDGRGADWTGQVRNLFVIDSAAGDASMRAASVTLMWRVSIAVAPAPSAHPAHLRRPSRVKRSDKDLPLIHDIRLLGRILGDVIREQERRGQAYELVEQVRKLSVAFRRDADQEADRALKKLLKGLTGDQTVSVIRAFTYFSHLANLAEDRHHIRRRAVHERAGDTQEGSIEVALARLRWAGIAPRTVVANPGQQLRGTRAHRPPHRGAAQEHSGRRARHRPAAGRAR